MTAADQPAIIDAGGALDWTAFDAMVERDAKWIEDTLRPAELVGLVPAPSRATVALVAALFEQQRVPVFIHPKLSEAEATTICEAANVRLVMNGDHEILRARAGPGATLESGAIFSTSGTTGSPKLVVLSKSAIAASADASAENLGWREHDRWLVNLTLAHVGGFAAVLRCLFARKTMVLSQAGFEPLRFMREVEAHDVTLASLVPTMLRAIVGLERRAPPSLRAMLIGGASAEPELLEHAQSLGYPVLPTYGLSEAGSQVCTHAPGQPWTRGDGVGRPLAGFELRTRREEIQVRGPALFDGYLDDIRRGHTRAKNAWFSTGDLGHIDDNGRLTIVGRKHARIITGGENVDPLEVERVLCSVPGVRGAVVFGIPDGKFGEAVAAIVEASAGVLPALRSAVEVRLAPFKWPRSIRFVDELERSSIGKVDRHATVSRHQARLVKL